MTSCSSPASFLAQALGPARKLVAPASTDEDARNNVDDSNQQGEKATSSLFDGEEDGLNVEFEKDTRNGVLWYQR